MMCVNRYGDRIFTVDDDKQLLEYHKMLNDDSKIIIKSKTLLETIPDDFVYMSKDNDYHYYLNIKAYNEGSPHISPNGTILSATIVIFIHCREKEYVLLVKDRSFDVLTPICGKCDYTKIENKMLKDYETTDICARREIFEECGIKCDKIRKFGYFKYIANIYNSKIVKHSDLYVTALYVNTVQFERIKNFSSEEIEFVILLPLSINKDYITSKINYNNAEYYILESGVIAINWCIARKHNRPYKIVKPKFLSYLSLH